MVWWHKFSKCDQEFYNVENNVIPGSSSDGDDEQSERKTGKSETESVSCDNQRRGEDIN